MITKIIACADIHIRNLRRQEEYQAQLKKFIDECKKIAEDNTPEQTRIVIAGDLLHNKLDISGEGYLLATWFLKQLDEICTTIVIAGNHDLNMCNLNRLDPISTIFAMCDFKRVIYLDKKLSYESGCLEDDDVIWCLYSSFDNYARPEIDDAKLSCPDKQLIGLYHGVVKSAKTDVGYIVENGVDPSYFDGLDFCIMGHIHKRQEIDYQGIPLVYCGSLIQKDHGENISGHGYVEWDVDDRTYECKDIPNPDYGFYTFKIDGFNDIDEDKEEIINL